MPCRAPWPGPSAPASPRTRTYVARRTAEGKTTREIRRMLKRYITRELYRALTPPGLRHSGRMSGFVRRVSSCKTMLESRVRARRAAVMLILPARRSALVTALPRAARTAGVLPVRARPASSR